MVNNDTNKLTESIKQLECHLVIHRKVIPHLVAHLHTAQYGFGAKVSTPIETQSLPQRKGIKGKEMALVWHEKASSTALQTSLVLHMHTLLVQTHNMPIVKEIAEQCHQL